ncbi:MAG: hypothetical protein KAS32_16275 [Candidatus Peribacteraceae bacterium]|nr:hypothetical protein [Candidatus Peribacteraceae bacterium]
MGDLDTFEFDICHLSKSLRVYQSPRNENHFNENRFDMMFVDIPDIWYDLRTDDEEAFEHLMRMYLTYKWESYITRHLFRHLDKKGLCV